MVLYFILIFKTKTFIFASQSVLARTVTVLLRPIFSIVLNIPGTLAFSEGIFFLTVMVYRPIFQSEVNMKFGGTWELFIRFYRMLFIEIP